MEKKKSDLLVETPWGKVVSASGMETIARGFSKDLEKVHRAISKMKSQLKNDQNSKSLEDIQTALGALAKRVEHLEEETFAKIQGLESSHEKIQTELREFMDLTRKTFRLFKQKLNI